MYPVMIRIVVIRVQVFDFVEKCAEAVVRDRKLLEKVIVFKNSIDIGTEVLYFEYIYAPISKRA